MLQDEKSYNIGEMAHVIAKHTDGPRGIPAGGSDGYENLILLCPTCHRKIDKAPPGVYSEHMLHSWKREHEAAIRQPGSKIKFGASAEIKEFVSRLLAENRVLWQQLGPVSLVALPDPGSNLHHAWHLRKLDTIIPNNRKIINAIEANSSLLSVTEFEGFLAFKIHAQAFEAHQYQPLDSYPLFPSTFTELFAL